MSGARDISNYKPYELVRQHFISRLLERRGIVMTEKEYDEFCDGAFTLYYAKTHDSSLAYSDFKGRKIWVLYNKKIKRCSTAYDADIDLDEERLIMCCFGKQLWSMAERIRSRILDEIKPHLDKKFLSQKEAATYYYNNSPFADMLMERYLHGHWRPRKMIDTVEKIIWNKHPLVKIDLKLKKPLQ